ncbi:MAG: four helix bundle protein [Chlorobiaceae bacterium]|nr:four helix bundle protein [Chlorobiaceae bacterium]
MAGIQKFEGLLAWQKARELTKAIYQVTSTGRFSKDFGLCDQIRRASVSVMSNLAEGFERNSKNEFHQFLVIAKGSCAEVKSQLYVALDAEYLDKPMFQQLKNQAEEVSRIIGGLRASVDLKRQKK